MDLETGASGLGSLISNSSMGETTQHRLGARYDAFFLSIGAPTNYFWEEPYKPGQNGGFQSRKTKSIWAHRGYALNTRGPPRDWALTKISRGPSGTTISGHGAPNGIIPPKQGGDLLYHQPAEGGFLLQTKTQGGCADPPLFCPKAHQQTLRSLAPGFIFPASLLLSRTGGPY